MSVTDAGGTYNGAPFPATATVAGVGGSGGSSLEGVSLSLAYYSGTYTSASQLAGLTPLRPRPSQAGSYTVAASFAGSTDYASATELADFTISQATPQITWGPLASIVYGTPLGAAQLDASANVPGTSRTPRPRARSSMPAAARRSRSTFTPQDSVDYATVTATTTITVEQGHADPQAQRSRRPLRRQPVPGLRHDHRLGRRQFARGEPGGCHPDPDLLRRIGHRRAPAWAPRRPRPPGPTRSWPASPAPPITWPSSPRRSRSRSARHRDDRADLVDRLGRLRAAVTFVATVAAAGTPSGTVTFLDDGTTLATVALDGSGTATLTTSALAVGSHSITATYSGDAGFAGAQSGPASESVGQAGTTVVLVPHPVLKKKKVKSEILTAEIEPTSPGGGVPTGTVTFELLTKKKKKTQDEGPRDERPSAAATRR